MIVEMRQGVKEKEIRIVIKKAKRHGANVLMNREGRNVLVAIFFPAFNHRISCRHFNSLPGVKRVFSENKLFVLSYDKFREVNSNGEDLSGIRML